MKECVANRKQEICKFDFLHGIVSRKTKMEEGGYPIPGILQSVRKRLISKELAETLV